MRVRFAPCLLFVAAAGLMASATAAEEKKADAKDPNRIICEKQEVLGSRLQTKRVCLTAAEWETKKREERQMIDRSQTQRHQPTGG